MSLSESESDRYVAGALCVLSRHGERFGWTVKKVVRRLQSKRIYVEMSKHLQTHDLKFESWQSEAEPTTSRSRRPPTLLNLYE